MLDVTTKKSFPRTAGPLDARVMIVGEAWGKDEEAKGRPLVGASGREQALMLEECGIDMESCFLTNVVNARPHANDFKNFLVKTADAKKSGLVPHRGLYITTIVRDGLADLYEAIDTIRPDVILCLGNYALWALTDRATISTDKGYRVPSGIMSWRGSQLYTEVETIDPPIPCLPLIHPAYILRDWTQRKIHVNDLTMRLPLALTSRWDDPIPREYEVEPSYDRVIYKLKSWLTSADRTPLHLAVDIETCFERIDCIGIADSINYAMCIPMLRRLAHGGLENYWTLPQYVAICQLIARLLSYPNVLVYGQGFLYDAQYFQRYLMVRPRVDFDTMLAFHVCFPSLRKGLHILASMFNQHYIYWKDENRKWTDRDDPRIRWEYNCKDCVNTFELVGHLRDVIASFGLESQFAFQMEQWEFALDMMNRGIAVDTDMRFRLRTEMANTISQIDARLETMMPDAVRPEVKKNASPWYTSPSQFASILYDNLGIEPIYDRKSGKRTTNKEAMKKIPKRMPLLGPLCDLIEARRSCGIYATNFLASGLEWDDRMRFSANVGGTYTFRWSVSENAFGRGCNMQTIPEGDEE